MQRNKRKKSGFEQLSSAERSSEDLASHSKALIEKRIDTIVRQQGRRPRILLAPLESGKTIRWTKPLAAFLAEFGFDVDIGPMSQAPLQAARLAIDNDVHIICVSVRDVTDQPLVVQLAEALEAEGCADIRLIAGGSALQQNDEELYRAGVDLIVNLDKADFNLIGQMLNLLDESGPGLKP